MLTRYSWKNLQNYINDHDLNVDLADISRGLAKAHAAALILDINDSIGTPSLLSPRQVAKYHHEVFAQYGIPAWKFGGTHHVPFVQVPTDNGYGVIKFDANSYSFLWCGGCDVLP